MSSSKAYDLSQYLTVKQFAIKVERSQQSIYKKMASPEFQRYVIEYNGKKLIHVSAITDLYTKHDETETVKAADTDHTEVPSRDDFIEFLKRQIEEKDRQIASLSEALKAEQVLRASADHRIALLESKETQAGETIEQRVYDQDQDQRQEPVMQAEEVRKEEPRTEETTSVQLSFLEKIIGFFRR